MKQQNKKISVVIPIYNVGRYLTESIESVINQTIGFENIQLILVNDGSTDNSHEICKSYKAKFSDDIIYIKQENGGVSAARNKGMQAASSEYITFLDGDDKWDLDAFELGIKFLEENQSVDLVAFPMERFDAETGNHYLNYKFESDAVISVIEKPDYIQNSLSSTIIRMHQIKSLNLILNEKISISEDMVFLYQLILPKLAYGVVNTSNYNYRVRPDNSSAINNSVINNSYYNETLKIGWNKIIEESIKYHGKVVEYVQAFILYEFKWRIVVRQNNSSLNQQDWNKYLELLKVFLEYVDDATVFEMSFLAQREKENYFMFKYEKDLSKMLRIKDNEALINDDVLLNFNNLEIIIDNMVLKENKLTMYGRNLLPIPHDKKDIYFTDNFGNKYPLEYYTVSRNLTNDNIYSVDIGFKVIIKNPEKLKTIFVELLVNGVPQQLKLRIINVASLSSSFSSLYLVQKNFIVKYSKEVRKLTIHNNVFKNRLIFELKATFHLLKRFKLNLIFYRILNKFVKIFNKKETWIVSDRIDNANDNGETFFRYLVDYQKNLNRKVYFAISKRSSDFKKLKKIGPVIDVNSIKYKILFLNSTNIISSHVDTKVDNPFQKNVLYMKDLYPKFNIFLQHGIIKDDLSPWLNVNKQKIDLFVTSSKYEYKSMFDSDYNFEKENIILTGLPRYDKLKNTEKNKEIILMPTWRRSLSATINQDTGKRDENASFINSQYFKLYNDFINNEKLLQVLDQHDYKIRFVPHNNMHQYIDYFEKSERVIFQYDNVNYTKLFNESALLITDFSSVAFDFAYLRKPLIYFQFDKETFYQEQIYDQGYFDYETNGFGPVVSSVDSLVDKTINMLKKDLELDSKYKSRIDDFFAFNDRKNNQRVYSEIIKLNEIEEFIHDEK